MPRFQSAWFRFLLIGFIILAADQTAMGDEFGRSGALEILLQPDKRAYNPGEPIILTIRLKNNTMKPLVVNRRLDPFNDLRWELFADPEGFMAIKTVPPKPLTADDFVELKPEEEIYKKLPPLSEITPDPLKRGQYGIRLTYANKEKPKEIAEKGKDIWTGEIVTNRISIRIRPGERASLSK